jgi:hypothetical protein
MFRTQILPFSKPVNVDEKEGIGCEELSWGVTWAVTYRHLSRNTCCQRYKLNEFAFVNKVY